MEEIKYVVHSDIDENNILKEFTDKDEAIKYATDHIVDKTYITMVTIEKDDNGTIIDGPEEINIWNYEDGQILLSFPESDINDYNIPDDPDYGEFEYPADYDEVDRPARHDTVKEAVANLEEHESEVECKCCFDLFPKETCIKTEDGYICPKCNQEAHSHQGTNLDLIDKDPFDLEYDDPRLPEEEAEIEIKEKPVDGNEMRKHEKVIEDASTITDEQLLDFDAKVKENGLNVEGEFEDEGRDGYNYYVDYISYSVKYENGVYHLYLSNYHASEDNNAEYPEKHTDEIEEKYSDIKDFYADYPDVVKDFINTPINEELKVISSFDEYKPWSGAVDTYNKISDAGKLSELESYLEELYPDGLTTTQINDILWFDADRTLDYLGLEHDPYDESLTEAKWSEEDEKLVEEILSEHIQDGATPVESDQVLQGTDNAVVDCPVAKVITHSEDEKTLDCKMEKPALEEPLAGEKIDIKLNESKIIVRAGKTERQYDNLDAAVKDVDNWYTNCSDEDFAENVLYALLCDLKDKEQMYEVDEKGNHIYFREALNEAKKNEDELPVDPEAVKLEVHRELNDLVSSEISAIDEYDEAKAEILDAPIEHKDAIIDTIDHIKDEEKEHVDELIDATKEIPFDKDHEAPVVEEAPVIEEPKVEVPIDENPLDQDFPEVEEQLNEDTIKDPNVKIGDRILIIEMEDEPQYANKEGIVDHIDDLGQIHGTWGGCALIPGLDKYKVIKNENLDEDINTSEYRIVFADYEDDDGEEQENVEYLLKPGQTKGDLVKDLSYHAGFVGIYVHGGRPATADEIKQADYLGFNTDPKLKDEDPEEYGDADDFNESLKEASSAETRAYKNGGKDLDDLVQGKAIARIKDPKARDAAVAAVKAGRPEIAKQFYGQRKENQAEDAINKKHATMADAGTKDGDIIK